MQLNELGPVLVHCTARCRVRSDRTSRNGGVPAFSEGSCARAKRLVPAFVGGAWQPTAPEFASAGRRHRREVGCYFDSIGASLRVGNVP